MNATVENKNKFKAFAFTIGFHAVLFLLLVLIVFITPLPPFEIKPSPEIEIGLGMEGFGNTDAGGSGQNDPDIETSEKPVPQKSVVNETQHIITDETETSAYVKSNPKNKTDNPITEVEKPIEVKPSSELLNALSALKNKKKHTGNGEGDGNTGGSGNGSNHGVGNGEGTGHGNGTPEYNGSGGGYDLRGRRLLRKPEQMTDSQEEGIVVVEIIVDETGKVVRATPGQRGSTTTSSNLFAKARQAALSVKFNPSAEGVKEQRGTYTFVFILE